MIRLRTPDSGEAESIAVCLRRAGTHLLTNDKRARNFCREHSIPCLDLPAILRGLWVRQVVSKERIKQLLRSSRPSREWSSRTRTRSSIDTRVCAIHANLRQHRVFTDRESKGGNQGAFDFSTSLFLKSRMSPLFSPGRVGQGRLPGVLGWKGQRPLGCEPCRWAGWRRVTNANLKASGATDSTRFPGCCSP